MATRYSQPQSGARIDWANPITKGLVFATVDGNINAVTGKQLPWVSSKPTKSVGPSGLFIDGNGTRYTDTGIALANSPLTLFSIWMARTSSQYQHADNDRILFSTRTAGNDGFSFGRFAAVAGGVGGNLTGGAYTVQGVAQYFAVNDIPSLIPTAVAATVSGTTLKQFTAGAISATATIGAGTNGGNLLFLAQGPTGAAHWLDRVSVAFAFNRALSDAEIKSISDNPWQLFRAANAPIFVPVSGGGGSPYTLTADAGALAITGNAAGLSVNRTLTAGAGALSITGNAATLAFNRALIADTANVATTGNAASLVFTPVGGPTYTIPADSAAVSISGAATSLVRGYNLTASAGAVSISASDAALIATRKLIADAYAAVIAGADATLTYTPITYPTIGRPASDTSNSGWTASTGTDLFAMVDEVTPDALDYIVTTATGSVCELALEQTAYPGTASQALKYRASSSTGNSLIVRLKNGATTIRTETQALTASDTEYTITLTSGEIAAITSGSLSVELESA